MRLLSHLLYCTCVPLAVLKSSLPTGYLCLHTRPIQHLPTEILRSLVHCTLVFIVCIVCLLHIQCLGLLSPEAVSASSLKLACLHLLCNFCLSNCSGLFQHSVSGLFFHSSRQNVSTVICSWICDAGQHQRLWFSNYCNTLLVFSNIINTLDRWNQVRC